ncbi:MAG TPA: hypothetical protein VH144_03090, partial [Candidatus Saccharimonadales bacterium]|nr:hypothetical protein [Candidatus Saccharimonadales bacterium]
PDSNASSISILAYFNYRLKEYRRAKNVNIETHAAAEQLAQSILPELEAHNHNVNWLYAVDGLPAGVSIAGIRARMEALVGKVTPSTRKLVDKGEVYTHAKNYLKVPMHSVDSDTLVGRQAWPSLIAEHRAGRAVIVNGTIHYNGGIFDNPSEAVEHMNDASKVTYLFEQLRRLLLDHLPPTQPRGYMPESGHSILLGNLAMLGGYESRVPDNEWYHLHVRAIEALRKNRAYKQLTEDYPVYPRWDDELAQHHRASLRASSGLDEAPLLDPTLAPNLQSIDRYLSREQYAVDTSGRSIENLVATRGIGALIRFDHGEDYTLWSQSTSHGSLEQQHYTIASTQVLEVLDGIYSYFVDSGGSLDPRTTEKLNQFKTLVTKFFPLEANDERQAWNPRYIDTEQRELIKSILNIERQML